MADDRLEQFPPTRKEAIASGAKRFFTGEKCRRGHVATRYASTGQCSECLKENERKWRTENPQKARDDKQIRRQGYRDKELASARLYRLNNRKKRLEATRKWRAENIEKIRCYNLAYRKKNPQRAKIHKHKRRALKHGAGGSYCAADISRIRKAQKDRCAYCGAWLKRAGEIDHIKALSKGGSNAARNLQLLCRPCNQSKSARDPIEFVQSRGFLV
jgi:5-methylcytosine-specific restriction endonuclease McrA